MRRASSLSWLMTFLALSACALGLLSLPDEFSQSIRLILRDLSRPGQALTLVTTSWCQRGWAEVRSWQARRSDMERLEQQLQRAQTREESYQSQLSALQQQLQQAKRQAEQSAADRQTEPLYQGELIEARVLGQETVALGAGRKMLAAGKSEGVGDNLLVIHGDQPVLDVGQDHGLALHQLVFSGEIVLGRTAACGLYSSSLQPVTDPRFQSAAQLLKKSPAGFLPGPEGILEGTGKGGCRLTGVWSGEAVEVGDEVYTPAADPLLAQPMYYGRVIRAEHKPGMPHWEIDVEPAALRVRPTFVRILRPTENAARVMAN